LSSPHHQAGVSPELVHEAIAAVRAASSRQAWCELGERVARLLELLAAIPDGAPGRPELVRLARIAVEDARQGAAAERETVGAELDVLRRGRRAVRAYG
jgi:hypothetical protein